MLGESDDLYNLRSRYYVGDYDGALREARSLSHLDAELAQQRDCLTLRCLLAQGQYSEVLERVEEEDPVVNQLLKIHAEYKLGSPIDRAALKEHCGTPFGANLNTIARVVACTIFMDLKDYAKAFEVTSSPESSSNLEILVSKVQLLLALQRLDLAMKELEKMKDIDDEHPLAVLATVWCLLRNGRESEEAEFSLDNLTSKFEITPLLFNLKSVAQMQSGGYSQAYELIKECQDSLQKMKHFDKDQLRISLTNEITCLLHMGKLQEADQQLSILKEHFPDCDFVRQNEDYSNKFDKFASGY